MSTSYSVAPGPIGLSVPLLLGAHYLRSAHVPVARVAAVVEKGDNLHLVRVNAENQLIEDAAESCLAFVHGSYLKSIVYLDIQIYFHYSKSTRTFSRNPAFRAPSSIHRKISSCIRRRVLMQAIFNAS